MRAIRPICGDSGASGGDIPWGMGDRRARQQRRRSSPSIAYGGACSELGRPRAVVRVTPATIFRVNAGLIGMGGGAFDGAPRLSHTALSPQRRSGRPGPVAGSSWVEVEPCPVCGLHLRQPRPIQCARLRPSCSARYRARPVAAWNGGRTRSAPFSSPFRPVHGLSPPGTRVGRLWGKGAPFSLLDR